MMPPACAESAICLSSFCSLSVWDGTHALYFEPNYTGRTMKSKSIRLTTTSYAVMSLLEMLGEAPPYDLKQALERSIENFWPVPHTTFYDEPARLARAGYLSQH